MSTKNRFVVEIDGVAACQATKVDGLDMLKHTPSKLMVGNRPNPIHNRGNYEVGEVTINHAESLGQTGAELYEWLLQFSKGESVERRNVRVMQMSEDGSTPIASYELVECVPTSFKNDGLDAASTDHGMFTFAVQPDDCFRL